MTGAFAMTDDREIEILEICKDLITGLTNMRADVADIVQSMDKTVASLAEIHAGIAGVHSETSGMIGRLDKIDQRLTRIEDRLNEPPK
jgi:hypothetical protein